MTECDEEGSFSDGISVFVDGHVGESAEEEPPGHGVVLGAIELVGLFIEVGIDHKVTLLFHFLKVHFCSLEVGPAFE